MSSEEIERLKEKIEKDPNSKLFVPLAEEYKKAGMYDEAIDALIKGLEKQPAYLSARVSLGKIYIERGMLADAMAEFEKVIAAIPENLYAHKKLAEIYKELGDKDKAIREFRTVLKLNPLDEWAATSLSSLEKEPVPPVQEPQATQLQEISGAEQEPIITEEGEGKPFGMPFTEKDMMATAHPEAKHEGEQPSEISAGEEENKILPIADEITEKIEETEDIPPETLLNQEEKDLWKSHLNTIQELKGEEENIPETSISEEDLQLWESHAEIVEKQEEAVADAMEVEELPEEESISFEDIFRKPEPAVQEKISTIEEKVSGESAPDIRDADQYIAGGKYFEAMNIYKKILSADPDNRHIMQRTEDLRALLKLLGRDKEELASRLESFLEGIKKRQNEFSGSS
ncbi:MAG: tetratricopeptide repeat protein [Nitrospira sp.]|nr:tetratricopeptide repeat protein [Nitrospira sp.]